MVTTPQQRNRKVPAAEHRCTSTYGRHGIRQGAGFAKTSRPGEAGRGRVGWVGRMNTKHTQADTTGTWTHIRILLDRKAVGHGHTRILPDLKVVRDGST